ncbi:Uncharacterised protein [Mycobacteroides abscessus subsp. abscessus]|nr:Uncharacterised protein [Mycobacteroides abscessus subsp. abscessus]
MSGVAGIAGTDVDLRPVNRSPDRLGCLLQRFGFTAGDDHRGASTGEFGGDGQSNAAARAGDECGSPGEIGCRQHSGGFSCAFGHPATVSSDVRKSRPPGVEKPRADAQ